MMDKACTSGALGRQNRMSETGRGATDWRGSQGIFLTVLLIAPLMYLSGCGSGQTDVGQANGNSVPVSLNISMPQESASASTSGSRFWATLQSWLPSVTNAWAVTYDLSKITVTVTDSDQHLLTTKTVDNLPSSLQSDDSIPIDLEVPVGSDRIFAVSAFDRLSGELRLQGQSTPTTLTAGQAAFVDVILIDITTGRVTGTVSNAGTGAPLSNATVAVTGTDLSTTTNNTGDFTLNGLSPGSQTLTISQSGFNTATKAVTVVAGTSVSAGTIALTPLPPIVDPVTGTVTNATNGLPIPSASVRIVNTNLQSTTNTNGSFTINDVPVGPRTVEASATGFIANSVTVNVVPGQTQPVGISLSPVILAPGQIRIILNWGRTPNDLDSHLLVPTTPTGEVCFSQRGTLSGSPFAQLDNDARFHSDRDSMLGAETITIAAPNTVPPPRFAGTYRYFVRNFLLVESDLLTSSGASVQVVTGDGDTEIARFTIPTTGTGRDWEVFTLDGATGSITPVQGSNGRITTMPTTQCQSQTVR